MGVTVRRGRGKIAVVSLAAVIAVAVTACGSGDSGGSENSSPAASADGVSSVPVPAGVAKDSVLDLNSTKDMTGVVTTVPIGESPYDENMPDICPLIPQSVVNQLGMAKKEKGFYGPKLVTQTCSLTPGPTSGRSSQVQAAISTNNFNEFTSNNELIASHPEVELATNINARIYRNRATDFTDGAWACEAVWGTFYGVATVSVLDFATDEKICDRAINSARTLVDFFPRSPSQMRPTS